MQEVISHFLQMLLAGRQSAEQSARALGQATRATTGSGYLIQPADPRWAEIFAGTDKESGALDYLRMTPRVPDRALWQDLRAQFGEVHHLPTQIPGTRQVMFGVDSSHYPDGACIFVTLDGEPDDANTAVVGLLLRRDPRRRGDRQGRR